MKNINEYNDRMAVIEMLPPSANSYSTGIFFGFRVIQLTHNSKILKSFIVDRESGGLRVHLLAWEEELLQMFESSQCASGHTQESHCSEVSQNGEGHTSEKPLPCIKPSCIMLLGDQLELSIAHSDREWQTIAQSRYPSVLNSQARASLRHLMLDLYSKIEKETQSV